MSLISGWLLSVVGIVIISVLVDLILPEGEMQKYIKAIFSVFVVFVMISPVLKININDIDFNKFIYNQSSVEINEDYIKNYNNSYKENLEKVCVEQLNSKGFLGVKVEISLNMSTKRFQIEKVNVNLKNLVINNNGLHIDKYQEIKSIIISVLGIESEKVVMSE